MVNRRLTAAAIAALALGGCGGAAHSTQKTASAAANGSAPAATTTSAAVRPGATGPGANRVGTTGTGATGAGVTRTGATPTTARAGHPQGDAGASAGSSSTASAAADTSAGTESGSSAGSDGSTGSSAATPSSSAGAAISSASAHPRAAHTGADRRLVVSADAICRSYRREVAGENDASTLPAQEQEYSDIVQAAQNAVQQLRGLTAPAAQASIFARFVEDTADAISSFEAAQQRSRSTQESSGVQTEQQDFTAFQSAGRSASAGDAAARALGMRVCGSPGSDWL
jgi:hypothetical protein